MEKKGKGSIDIGEFLEDLEKFVNAFERIQKLSNWMTTISLAMLGFILALLFQIKSSAPIPNEHLAVGVLVFFVISVLLGFYSKFRYELYQFGKDLKRGARGVSGILQKGIKELSLPEKTAKVAMMADASFKEFLGEFPKSMSKHTLFWPVIGQFLVLTIGSILFSVYIGLYLFAMP